MMIKHILKQIWNEKRSNIWLWAELLVVFVFLWYIVDNIYTTARVYYEPMGFDITDTYMITLGTKTDKSATYIPAGEKTTTAGADLWEISERLKRLPEVEDVSISRYARPYSGGNSSSRLAIDTLILGVLQRPITPSFFNVFRYENTDKEGGVEALMNGLKEGEAVVGGNLLPDSYKGDRRLMGKTLTNADDSTKTWRISGVTNKVRYGDFWSYLSDRYIAFYLAEKEISSWKDVSWIEVCLRVKPGVSEEFPEYLMELSDSQFNVGNLFILKVDSFKNIRQNFQRWSIYEVQNQLWIMAFLLVNIFLGIIGTFWFRTQQRRAELGLRLAMGSSKIGIWNLLWRESIMLLILALLPALLICYNVGSSDIVERWTVQWGVERFLIGTLVTAALMILMIIAGIWYPARQAMKIEPAEALHNE